MVKISFFFFFEENERVEISWNRTTAERFPSPTSLRRAKVKLKLAVPVVLLLRASSFLSETLGGNIPTNFRPP